MGSNFVIMISIQVDNKKAQPHLLFCKIWRWPDLKQHGELHGLCKMGHGQCMTRICINPYHYWRQADNIPDPAMIAYFLERSKDM